MKVVVLSFFSGLVERGVENWANQLKSSQGEIIEVVVIGNDAKKMEFVPREENTLARKFFLDYWSRKIAQFTASNFTELRRIDPDIIIPTNGGWQTLLIRLYCLFYRKKIVVVGHSGIGYDDAWNLFCFPDYFVALSTKASQWAKKVNPLVKVKYIPNGIPVDFFEKQVSPIRLKLEKPIFLYVGALERSKRPLLAIEAVSKLKRGSLLVVGNGSLREEVQHFGEMVLGKRFLLTTVPHSQIQGYYTAADVFTLPTWSNEAFGMVYLEALASGLPVVTTDDDIKREIVGYAGLYVNPEEISKYSEALEKAAQSDWKDIPLKQSQKFSWEIIAKKYESLFQEVLKK